MHPLPMTGVRRRERTAVFSVYNAKNVLQMAELVIQSSNGNNVTTSLIVAQVFGKEHKHVLRDIDELSCSDDFRVSNFGLSFIIRYLPNGGSKKERYYEMTKDGFSFLVMGYTGKKAGEFKEKFINNFNEMEKKIRRLSSPSYQIEDPISRAERWIEEQKEKLLMESKNEQLEELNGQLAEENIKLAEENLTQKPKVEFADSIMQSSDCISVGDMATILKQNDLFKKGQNAFFMWLRYNGYLLCRGIRYNLPTQKSMNAGIMRIAERPYMTKGEVIINKRTVITPYGQQYFLNLFRKNKSKKSQTITLFD